VSQLSILYPVYLNRLHVEAYAIGGLAAFRDIAVFAANAVGRYEDFDVGNSGG